MTEQQNRQLPPLYSQENVAEPMVWVKYFHPLSDWTWYGIEYDEEDIFFGWVAGFEGSPGAMHPRHEAVSPFAEALHHGPQTKAEYADICGAGGQCLAFTRKETCRCGPKVHKTACQSF